MQVQARAHLSATATDTVTININESFDRPITHIMISDFTMRRSYLLGVTQFQPAMRLCLAYDSPTLQIANERQYFASAENRVQVLATTNLTQISPFTLANTQCVYHQLEHSCKEVTPSRLIGKLTFQVKESDSSSIVGDISFSFVVSFI